VLLVLLVLLALDLALLRDGTRSVATLALLGHRGIS
jgi:hypothetical protein